MKKTNENICKCPLVESCRNCSYGLEVEPTDEFCDNYWGKSVKIEK